VEQIAECFGEEGLQCQGTLRRERREREIEGERISDGGKDGNRYDTRPSCIDSNPEQTHI
jgi:hypothetical protein